MHRWLAGPELQRVCDLRPAVRKRDDHAHDREHQCGRDRRATARARAGCRWRRGPRRRVAPRARLGVCPHDRTFAR